MRWMFALAASAAVVSPALAQDQRPALFISPMGQPVRAPSAGEAMQAWFSAADADQDGRLSLEEFWAHEAPFHAALDRNGDGLVTQVESSALLRATAPEIYAPLPPLRGAEARMPRDPGRMTQPRERGQRDFRLRGAARFGLLPDIEPVMSCDTDMSRWITEEEFALCAQRRFDILDANNDGAFTLDESPRAVEILEGREPD